MNSEVNESIRLLFRFASEWRLASLLMSRPDGAWAREVELLARESLNEDLRHAAKEALSSASEEYYLALLGPAGGVSPREIAYIGLEDPGFVLADLMNFYQSFHYAPAVEDPDDHIAVQLGFAGFLTLKEAFALASDHREACDLTRIALEHFLEKHLSRLIRGIAPKLIGNEPQYFQSVMLHLLQRVSHIPEQPVLKSADPGADVFQCGF